MPSQRITRRSYRRKIQQRFNFSQRPGTEKSGFYGVSGNKIILTGGSSQLQGIKEVSSHIFNKYTRIAKPVDIIGMPESSKGPAFSTVVGMLLYAAKQKDKYEGRSKFNPMEIVSGAKHGSKGFWLVEWFKRNF